MQRTLAPLLFDSFKVDGIGQIHHSHSARDRKREIATPKTQHSQSLLLDEYLIWIPKKQHTDVTITFFFGKVNRIKFPEFSPI